MTGVRLDKWLWAARFFKTRSLAAQACELGRVQVSGQPAKPARAVQVNTVLRVTTPGDEYEVRVLQLSETRGPAPVARTLYEETEASRVARAKAAEIRRLNWEPAAVMAGRPSKRDRRQLSRLRGTRRF
jgi:ribosome-associated heat shock protein Hsp15